MTKIGKKILTAVTAAACILSVGACGGNGGARPEATAAPNATTTAPAQTTTTTPPATLAEEAKEAINEIETDLPELENKEVHLLACFDLNPRGGQVKSPAIEMFERKLGGKIVTDLCSWNDRYDKLATLVNAGDSPDMFSAEDLDIIPGNIIFQQKFMAMDKYIDYDSELWAPVKELNDQFALNGKHYLGLTSTDLKTVLIYNKKTIEENGLSDPAQLVMDGEWDWNAMYDMFSKFCNPADEIYGIDCWEFEPDFALTCGVPYVGMKDGQIVHNLKDPMVQKVQDFFLKLNRAEIPMPVTKREIPLNIGQGKTLFFAKGAYCLYEPTTIEGMGMTTEDLMFVPLPKCPEADEWYLPSVVKGFSIPLGAKNPEGTAAYLNCVMICRDNEKVKEIEENQLFNEYGWTQEMYDMLIHARELTDAHPVFDYQKTINDDLYGELNEETKASYNHGTPWGDTVDALADLTQTYIDEANERLAALS